MYEKTGYGKNVQLSYVNNYRTVSGGMHVKGLHSGVMNVLHKYVADKDKFAKFKIADIHSNLNFVIHVRTKYPRWVGCTKNELANAEVKRIVASNVEKHLDERLQQDAAFIKTIIRDIE